MLVKSDAYRNYCLLTSQCELISQFLKAGNKIFYGFVWEMVLGVWKQREWYPVLQGKIPLWSQEGGGEYR